ncbi:E2F-associated phosphoprotein-like [Uloborus diversus]|uniref:E2F-associated phosphoprotein-like n=1 Tax=Uloborus diversus TaxID=327109 RepID=UPI00240A5501|nr:E2F-associated phosphoprotein-like [Uloborus diversus]
MDDEYVIEEQSDEEYDTSSSEDEFTDFIKRECGILEVEDDFEAEVDKVMSAHMDKIKASTGGKEQNEASCSNAERAFNYNDEKEKINDELLYDPDMDDDDEKWINEKRRSYIFPADKSNKQVKPLPNSDAVLNCPACLSLLCLDCQRHDIYKNQYRAMFVSNCNVNHSETLKYPVKKKKMKNTKMLLNDENYNPVVCSICNTEVAVYDSEEVYHFFNVLASY